MKRFLVLAALVALVAAPAALACDRMAQAASAEHGCPFAMKGVERTVNNLNNGVEIVMKASDVEVVKALQTKVGGCAKSAAAQADCGKDCLMGEHASWTRKIENTDRGVKVILTASSPDDVQQIQSLAATMAKGGCAHAHGAKKGDCPHAAQGDRT
ncbi:MAG: hypothetical protein KBD01_09670 [Acidobacteria bacterium]|nr:hypothetical protein [Acidobacteriota bacterium]